MLHLEKYAGLVRRSHTAFQVLCVIREDSVLMLWRDSFQTYMRREAGLF